MRVLVTGSAGFIGSHLVDRLRREHEVWGFDNYLTGSRENLPADSLVREGIDLDITNRADLYEFANLAEPDLIVHCAASYSDPDKWHRDTQTNVEGAINVAAMARHHKARVIYFQTILPPVSSYAISKIAAEHYLAMSGVPLTVFRLANVYGPRNLSGPVPVFYKRITNGQSCVVVDTTRDMIFIQDVVECVLRSLEIGAEGVYDVCSGRQTSIMELFKLVAFRLGHEEVPPLIPPAPDDVQGFISPQNGLPGWRATTRLPDGIAKTVASYRKGGVAETHTHLRLKG